MQMVTAARSFIGDDPTAYIVPRGPADGERYFDMANWIASRIV
jgi:hypothetical protein